MEITRFAPILQAEAQLSKDPGRKVCAAAFDKYLNRLASGWNGLPRKVEDHAPRYEKPLKELYVVHAEANLVASAARLGISLQDSHVLLTEYQPCANCAGLLVQAGVSEVWYPVMPTSGETVSAKWLQNFDIARTIFQEAGVLLKGY